MRADFIAPDDPRWQRYLENHWHDFYHLPDYVRLCARQEGGIPAAFYGEAGDAAFLAPLILRPVPESLTSGERWSDCVSPYGYSTPLVAPTQDALPTFLEAFLEVAKEHRLVTAFFRLHPFSQLNQEALSRFGQLVHHGQTIYIDLAQTEKEFWAQVRRNHKQNIQRLMQGGVRVSFDDWSLLREFAALYHYTMSRVGAVTCLYNETYFDELKAVLGDSMHLCCVLSEAGQMIAGGIFVEMGGLVHYHLSATATEYIRYGPNKLIIPFMRSWSQRRSNKVLHLGGGVGGMSDSLFHFKAGFSDARAEFYSYRVIVNRQAYDALSRAAGSRDGLSHADPPGYFPAYRRQSVSVIPHRLGPVPHGDSSVTALPPAWLPR